MDFERADAVGAATGPVEQPPTSSNSKGTNPDRIWSEVFLTESANGLITQYSV